MSKKGKKLNAMRLLEQQGIDYEVFEFSPEIHSAVGVAEAVGVPVETVYKTLVAIRPNGKPVLAIIPGPASLDLKTLAAALGEKKMSMAAHTEAEELTGLQVGGISGLALTHKNWTAILDSSALAHDAILVSAGQRGINLRLPVADLQRVLQADVAAVIRENH